MFSTKLSRAAHRATTSHTAAAAITATSSTAYACTRPTHQRRPSSSKASWRPDSSAPKAAPTSKAAPTTKADSTEAQEAPVSEEPPQQKSNKGKARGGYRRAGQASNGNAASSKEVAVEPVDQFAGLPSVPSLQGLDAKGKLEDGVDLMLSTFFSLHRPLSVTTSIPPPATPERFNTLFASQRQRQASENPWENGNSAERRPEDVIYSLRQTIESLNGARDADEDGIRWEVIQESSSNSDGVMHLDGTPKSKSLDELVAQFRPFKAPPPPQPFPDSAEAKEIAKKASQKPKGRPRQKTYTTTITLTESLYDDGQKTYSAQSSPMMPVPDPQNSTASIQEPPTRQPFLTRMYRRRLAQTRTAHASFPQTPAGGMSIRRREPSDARQERMQRMYMISVKRQRKLKMKKHKYKKLMKRTRVLRRKLDRN